MLALRSMLPRSRTSQIILVGTLFLGLAWLVWQSGVPRAAPTTRTAVHPKEDPLKPAPALLTLPAPDQRQQRREAALAAAPVIEQRTLPPDAEGRYVMQRVIQWHGKYPLLRIEEDHRRGTHEQGERRWMVADHLMVKRRAGFTEAQFLDWVQGMGLTIRRHLPGSDIYLIGLPSGSLAGFDAMLHKLNGDNLPVDYAEPDPLRFAASTPNDPLFPIQWALHNAGQTGGAPDVDVDAPEAWATTRGNGSLVVAVLDSGLDVTHPDLQPNLWVNTAETPSNGQDDDWDGFVDNVNGWNFYHDSKDLADYVGHGTHCAGVVGAVGNNAAGVSGIAPSVKLMPLRVMSSGGEVITSDAVAAMNHAVAKRVFLTSNSYGGTMSSKTEKAAIDSAMGQGILVVCAAGNDYPAKNIDSARLYPAAYASANIISVAATTDMDARAVFSNYGPTNVDLGAPGVGILSTLPGGKYGYESGTSMACPLVAGACVLVKAAHPTLGWSDIKSAILNGVDPAPALQGKVKTGGRLNVARAVKIGAQPWIELTKTEVKDAKLLGANGNGDGIFNAGEDVTVAITIKNVGPLATPGLSTRLTVLQNASDVTLMRDTRTWGSVAAGTSLTNNTATALPFLLRIAHSAVEQQITLVFTHTDSASRTWTSQSTLTVAGTQTLSGKVTLLTGGKPLKGAVVSYTGPATGSAMTTTDGTYTARLPDGTYTVSARLAGYEASPPQQITVPPAAAEVNFALGRATLLVEPTALAITQPEQGVATKTLTLTNKGDLPLNLSVQNSSLGNVISTGYYNRPSYGAAHSAQAAYAPLPWQDGFESGTSSLVPSRYHEEYEEIIDPYIYYYVIDYYLAASSVVTDTAAVGRRSLHYRDPWFAGFDNGMQRRFGAATQPRYVSYWVRPGSSTGTSGCFSLEDGYFDDYAKKWAWSPIISILAEEGGKLSANGSLSGGDKTVPFTPKAWHHIELRNINWTTRTFDYWVNGSVIKTGIPFMGTGTQAVRAHIYNNTIQGESWWDELHVLDQDDLWLSHTPSTLALAPGASGTVDVTASAMNQRPGVFKAQLNVLSNDPVRPVVNVPVTMTVTPHANTAPVATSQTVTTPEDAPVTISLIGSDADNDALTFYISTKPKLGKLMIGTSEVLAFPAKLPGTTITYVPPAERAGSKLASFTFTAVDYRLQSKPATVTVDVTPVNDPPLATDDFFSLFSQGETFNVLSNDGDAEGDKLTPSLVSSPTRGTASFTADNWVFYTPAPSFQAGMDKFSYHLSDGNGQSRTAVVTITLGQLESLNDWTTFGGSMERNGSTRARLNDRPLLQQWSANLGTVRLRQAAIVGTRAVISSGSSTAASFVAALDLTTGEVLWKQALPDASSTGAVTVDGSHVYLAQYLSSGSGTLWCLDLTTGAILWQTSMPKAQSGSPAPAAFEGDVIVLTSNEYVEDAIRYDGATGAEIQRYGPVADKSRSDADAPCIANGQLILRPFTNGIFRTYDLATGNLIEPDPNTSFSGAAGQMIIAQGKRVFIPLTSFSSSGLRLYNSTSSAYGYISGYFHGAAASDGTEVCAITKGSYKTDLYDHTTLKLLRSYATPGKQCYYQPLLLRDAVLLSDAATSTFVFNRTTAQLLQTLPTGGELSLGHGYLLIAGNDGKLSAWTAPSSNARIPVATAQTASGTEDTPLAITLSGTDANAGTILTASISTLPASGTLWQTVDGLTPTTEIKAAPSCITHPAMKVILVPALDAYGTAQTQFEFRVNDGRQVSMPARVTVNLAAVADPPKLVNDRLYVSPDMTTVLRPLANDVEPDGETMQITSLTAPDFGTATLNGDNTVSVTCAAEDYGRSYVLDYVVSDSTGRTAQATMTVIVAGPRPDEWPYADNTAGNLRYYPGTLGESGYALRWSHTLAGASTPPIIAEGTVFVVMNIAGGQRPEIRAIDLITGAEKWRMPMPGPDRLNYTSRSCEYLTYANGDLYLLDYDSAMSQHGVVCLSAADGSLRWRREEKNLDSSQPLRVVDSLVIAAFRSNDLGIVAFNIADGSKAWSNTFGTSSDYDVVRTGIAQDSLFTLSKGQFSEHSLSDGSVTSTRTLVRPGDGTFNYITSDKNIVLDHSLALLSRTNVNSSNRMYAVDVNSPSAAGYAFSDVNFCALPVSVGGSVLVPTIQSIISVRTPALQISGAAFPALASGYSYTDIDLIVAQNVVLAKFNSGLSVLRRSDRQITNSFSRSNMKFSKVCAASGRVIAYAEPLTTNGVKALDCYSVPTVGNHAPVATAQTLTVVEEAEISLTLSATDEDAEPLRYAVQSLPAKGTLYQTTDGITRGAPVLNLPAFVSDPSGRLIFVSALDGFGAGAGSFNFAAYDSTSTSSTSTVNIDITGSNDPPLAVPDTLMLRSRESLTAFKPQANDRDSDGDVLPLIATTTAAHGTVTLAGNGLSLTYTPDPGFISGTDSFDYTIRDAGGIESTAEVSIEIAPFGAPWLTNQANASRNSFVPTRLGTSTLQQRWTKSLPTLQPNSYANNGFLIEPPVVVGGHVMLGHHTGSDDSGAAGQVISLDAETGADLWRTPSQDRMDNVGLTWHSGRLYLLHASMMMKALSDADGGSVWSLKLPDTHTPYGIINAPTVTSTGIYVAVGSPVKIRQVSPAGSLGFSTTVPNLGLVAQLTACQDSVLAAPQTNIVAVNAISGTTQWDLTVPDSSTTSSRPCASQNTAFVIKKYPFSSELHWQLIAVDLTTQQLKWQLRLKPLGSSSSFAPTPAAAHQAVFAQSGTQIVMFDEATGREVRSFNLASDSTSLIQAPIITADSVVAVSSGSIRIFDLQTGNLRQTLSISDWIRGVSVAGDSLYVATYTNNTLICYSLVDTTNAAPTAQAQTLSGNEDQAVLITLAGSDATNDPLVFDVATLPANGKLYQTPDGTTLGAEIRHLPTRVTDALHRVIYVPLTDQFGTPLATFTFTVDDGNRNTAATVTLNISNVNDTPMALADAFSAQVGQLLSPLPVLGNDYDLDLDALTIVSFTQPASGTVVQNSDGTLRYQAPASIVGLTSTAWTYTVQDNAGNLAIATVNISFDPMPDDSWPMHGKDNRHSGYSPGEVSGTGWAEIWRKAKGKNNVRLLADHGRAYVTTTEPQTLEAMELATGAQVWMRNMINAYPLSLPLVSGSSLYLQNGSGTSNCKIEALSTTTGASQWSTALTTNAYCPEMLSPLLYGTQLIAPGSNYYLRLSSTTGTLQSNRTMTGATGYQAAWTPSLTGDSLISHQQGKLYVDDLTSGTQWSLPLAIPSYSDSSPKSVATAGNLVFAIDSSFKLNCINLTTRSIIWTASGYEGIPAVRGNEVYALVYNGNAAQALSILDGSLLRTYNVGGPNYFDGGQPVVTDNLLILRPSSRLCLFDRLTGQLLQTLTLPTDYSSYHDPLILAGETLLTVDYNGNIIAYAPAHAITFSPASGSFASAQNITLTANDADATIRYTTDGSAPNLNSPTVANGASVLMDRTGKLRAITVKGSAVSRIVEASYTIGAAGDASAVAFKSSSAVSGFSDSVATADFDRDGQSDLAEAVAGTNPMNAADVFEITDSRISATDGASLSISWPSKTGRSYRVQRSTDLQTWIDASASLSGTGATITHRLPAPTSGPCFLRVRIE